MSSGQFGARKRSLDQTEIDLTSEKRQEAQEECTHSHDQHVRSGCKIF